MKPWEKRGISHVGGDLGFLVDICWLFHPNSLWQVQEIQAGREPLQLLPALQRPDRRHRWVHLVPQRLSPTSYFCRQIYFNFCFVASVVFWSSLFSVFPWFWQAFVEWRFISQLSFRWLNVCPQVVDIKITSKITTHIPLEVSQCFFGSNENLFLKKRHLWGVIKHFSALSD